MDKSKTWKRYALIGLVVALAFGGGLLVAYLGSDGRLSYTDPRGNPSASAGDVVALPVPERRQPAGFEFADEQGRRLRFDDLKGRVVLLNLWATWCPPCVAEMGALDALQQELGGERFQVMAVSIDRGGAPQVRRWFDKQGIAHLAIFTAEAAQFPNALLPTSILLDSQGRVAWHGAGIRDWEGEAAKATIRQVMAE